MDPSWTIFIFVSMTSENFPSYLCIFFFFKLFLFIHLSQFSRPVVFNSLQPHGLQHTRLPCPSLSPGVCSNSCALSPWCHLTISFSVTLFSYTQSFSASGSFPVSQLFTSGGQSIGASALASILPVKYSG